MNFISPPTSFSNWVVYPLLIVGYAKNKDELSAFENIQDQIKWTAQDNYTVLPDEKIADWVANLCSLIRAGRKVYINDESGFYQSRIYLTCFIQSWFRWDLKRAEQYLSGCLKFAEVRGWLIPDLIKRQQQVKRYRRPLRVLMCGDRNSAVCFEENITFELKSLPKYSVVIHGGCKGVDLYAAELATLQGIETKAYPAEWDIYGLGAGPIRNKKMLVEEAPDMVIAFHPDIEMSKGTRNMMTTAWKYGTPVYIHDLKRKMKFEGDFSVL